MGLSNSFKSKLLRHTFLNEAITLIGDASGLLPSAAAGVVYFRLQTGYPGEGGDSTVNEATYTGYAAKSIARGAGFTEASQVAQNAAALVFDPCTGGSNEIQYYTADTAATGSGGLMLGVTPVGATAQGPFTAKADDTITLPGHSLIVDNRVAFFPVFNSALPTGITEGTLYWVKTVSVDDITISTTQGGGTLNITAVGDGFAIKCVPLAVSSGHTPEFAAGAITISLD